MIQRIQSLFLLLAAGVMGILLIPSLSFLNFNGESDKLEGTARAFLADQAYNIYDQSVLLGMVAATAALSLITIFLYGNRPLQLRINKITMAAGILVILLAAIFFYPVVEESDISLSQLTPGVGLALPVIWPRAGSVRMKNS